ncbi:Uncharacterised protein [Mycobacteroides abscessus subsp. massiliense]|nr:Uncharacterised protein [Mycobacteroides abscessus subsp. abscessus]SKF88253.1 Uncharacterised protein [Mycobacteroides abscessus subsp. massiliense]SHS89562.1 Uncharacterised protein [Mycobacteroides abscessus subsp. abscessus]SHT35911.1 Uncharacterised protein [Mycobacteroides abscessus subsp. abscessus]SHT41045.1 Uncharacterised protein [Mycobacteroides abscessus subsp. abscessus]
MVVEGACCTYREYFVWYDTICKTPDPAVMRQFIESCGYPWLTN